ncbi:catalase-like [Pelodytes ibericus]
MSVSGQAAGRRQLLQRLMPERVTRFPEITQTADTPRAHTGNQRQAARNTAPATPTQPRPLPLCCPRACREIYKPGEFLPLSQSHHVCTCRIYTTLAIDYDKFSRHKKLSEILLAAPRKTILHQWIHRTPPLFKTKIDFSFKKDWLETSADREKKTKSLFQNELLTTSAGIPIGDKESVMTAGPRGPLLMQDVIFTEEMAHFVRERIPERVVHAKGAGAFGYFEVTNDITQYCKARVFEKVGKKTPVAVRFSTTGGESGTSDTVRDPRGFSVKFYTEQGNWDLVGNNTPIFFIRDPILFPSLSHAQKRNPQTHTKDPNAFWDFMSLRPETLHELTDLFSDNGIPDGFRHMDGYGNHAFKMVNAQGNPVYCKFVLKTNQGIKRLSTEEALSLAASNPDYALQDLFDSIAKGQFPSWDLWIQVMTFSEARAMPFNPFDITKVWPEDQYPQIPVGRITLNKNPENYFCEVEQLAFEPKNMVPGIEPSPDKMLHARLFAYSDAQRYRLGANYTQIPVNSPKNAKVANYQRDGGMAMGNNQGNRPGYYPNSCGGPEQDPSFRESVFNVSGDVDRYDDKEDNVIQVRKYYMELEEGERRRLHTNLAQSLSKAVPIIQKRAVKNFTDVHPSYGAGVQVELDKLNAGNRVQETFHPTPEIPKLRNFKLH